MMKKRIMQLFLTVCLCIGMTAVASAEELAVTEPAAEDVVEEPAEELEEIEEEAVFSSEMEVVFPSVELEDREDLYEGFLEELFFEEERMELFGTAARESLGETEQEIYDALKPILAEIAAGERESTVIAVGQSFDYNGEEHPVDAELTFSVASLEAQQAQALLDALLLDLPYDMYWFGSKMSTLPWVMNGNLHQVVFSFEVSPVYRADADEAYVFDTTEAEAAVSAAETAADIVKEYRNASDYEKLTGYRDAICELVSYHTAAAETEGYEKTDIRPWHLIGVFDGDDATMVVCEGYSKAFQYLCELSDFDDAESYLAEGIMATTAGQGGHMWNIVTLEGNNYLVDVTNSDTGSIGMYGGLFLAGGEGSPDTQYNFTVPGQGTVVYAYYSNYMARMSEDVLTLASADYEPSAEEDTEPLELPAPDLTVVTSAGDPSGLPVGTIYYTNVPDAEEWVECYVQVYDEYGDRVESFYHPRNESADYYVVRLASMLETDLATGEYTISATYCIYDDGTGEEVSGETTEIVYDYTHPDAAYQKPTAGWSSTGPAMTIPAGDDVMTVVEIGYFLEDDRDFAVMNTWYYTEAAYAEECFAEELEFLQFCVEEDFGDREDLMGGIYQYRVRALSDDLFTTYHSDWSDWCEVGKVTEEENNVLPAPVLMWLTERTTVGTQKYSAGKLLLTDIPELDKVNYQMKIYQKNSSGTETLLESYSGYVSGTQNAQTMNLGWYVEDTLASGTYIAKMYYKGDGGATWYDSETTELEFDYVKPSAQYGKVTDLGWTDGKLSYTLPADAIVSAEDDPTVFLQFAKLNADGTVSDSKYLYRGGQHFEDVDRLNDRLNDMVERYGNGKYVYRMRVISWNLLEKSHSEWSDWSTPILVGEEVVVTPDVVTWNNGLPEVDSEVLKEIAEAVSIMAVLYDINGRCMNVVMADYDEETGYDLSAFDAGGAGTTAKVFFYDKDHNPLCEESIRI